MNTTRIVLAALVIFAAGVLTGAVGAGLAGRILRQRPQSGDLSSPVTAPAAGASNRSAGVLAKPPGNAQLEAMARWSRELELESAQREQIEAILKRAQSQLRDLWVPVAPQARSHIETARYEIEGLLSAEQRRRWDEARRRRGAVKPAGVEPPDQNP